MKKNEQDGAVYLRSLAKYALAVNNPVISTQTI